MVGERLIWESTGHADPRGAHRDAAQPGSLHVRADREGLRDRANAEPGEAGPGRAAAALIGRPWPGHRIALEGVATELKMHAAASEATAGDRGIEPRAMVLETIMLPLHQSPWSAPIVVRRGVVPSAGGGNICSCGGRRLPGLTPICSASTWATVAWPSASQASPTSRHRAMSRTRSSSRTAGR